MGIINEYQKLNTEELINKNIQHVFIIGSKGIPANYGGFETFVEKLTFYQKNKRIKYHVANMSNENTPNYEFNGADCFYINVPNIGPAKAIYYDIMSLKYSIEYCKANSQIEQPIFYILACRIGPFINHFKKQIKKLGGYLYINPDGHEWKRQKWSYPVKKYWKLSERLMIKNGDLIICDSVNIEKYIHEDYYKFNPKTTYIAYGADCCNILTTSNHEKITYWYNQYQIKKFNYYLVVGRFVPENNYEIMIKEFMKSNTEKDFILITNINEKFITKLKKSTNFDKDKRIKFVGTVYDKELLSSIRKNAYGYLHGHEVGGTNPSLLEALGSTNLNLLLDVGFNREVAKESAFYWNKENLSLSNLINKADKMKMNEIVNLGELAKSRISNLYSWDLIVNKYEDVFVNYRK